MMKKVGVISLLALVLASCEAAPPVKPMALGIDPHKPQVDVTVDSGTGATNITAPDTLYFPSNERCKDTTITWHLSAPPGHRFHGGTGIQFGPDADGDIVGCHYVDKDGTYECTNKHCKGPYPRTYEYVITVDDKDGHPHRKDPAIANN